MEIIELKDLSNEGVFFEDEFDRKFKSFNWNQYDEKAVRISACGLDNVPAWVYLLVGIELSKHARKIFFGDAAQPKRIFRREDSDKHDAQVNHGL